jgi:hypothetical protein
VALGRITIRERIDPAITASLFSNYRSSADAVLELVDNAVDSRLPAVHLSIEVMSHPTSLVVVSAGGDGMGVRELERNYLRWGGSAKRGKQLLGQYGQGGKAAIGHLGKRFTVEASRPGDEAAHAPLLESGGISIVLTMNKSDFDRDSPQWVEVENRLHRVLAPIVRRLEREGEAPPPANAVKVAEQVRRLLGQALRLTERADIFAGFAAVAPQGRPASGADNELPLEVETEPKSPKPRVPPPAQDSASAVHRGFGTIVIRPLDRNIRSLTTVEEGVRVVVINSNYPLFKERRGDIWYQLETAAREVCRAAEGANVAEYERRVNEIVLMATALRDRRRVRGRSSGEQLRLLKPG